MSERAESGLFAGLQMVGIAGTEFLLVLERVVQLLDFVVRLLADFSVGTVHAQASLPNVPAHLRRLGLHGSVHGVREHLPALVLLSVPLDARFVGVVVLLGTPVQLEMVLLLARRPLLLEHPVEFASLELVFDLVDILQRRVVLQGRIHLLVDVCLLRLLQLA